MGGVVLHNIDERRRAILLNRRSRNQRRALQRIHQQAGIDKLIRKQRRVFVIKQRPRLDRARSRIDLVVHRQQL